MAAVGGQKNDTGKNMADITIKDIARQCGVGVSTVSRALNNHPDINPDTREKIMEVIRETGFVPNNSARFLKRSETNSIALLVKGITNPFFMRMIQVMEESVEDRNYTTILRHVGPMEDEVLVALSLVKERKIKGIIFLGGNFTHDSQVLEQIGVPFVFATIGEDPEEARRSEGQHTNGKVGYANIAVDDVQASYEAVSYLIGLGHRKIGIIAEGLGIPSVGQLRFRGYRKALTDHGIPFREEYLAVVTEGIEHYSLPNGYRAAKELLEKNPDLTSIFCISDVLAMGACRAILDTGRRIPEDVSVIGFDGIETGDYYNPRVTTMQQPFTEISRASISILFGMVEKKEKPQDRIMAAELVVRESTGKAPEETSEEDPEKAFQKIPGKRKGKISEIRNDRVSQ